MCTGLCTHGPLHTCARHWPAVPPVRGRGTKPLRAEKSGNAPKGASRSLPISALGALVVGLVAECCARKCAKNAVWPEFCSHCSHCSKRSGNALSPCLCGVPTVPTVTTQKSERGKECTQSVKWSMHIIGRGVRGFSCSRAGAVVLPVVCLGACGVLPLCLPWGLMRRAGGAWKVWGAHAGNRPVP